MVSDDPCLNSMEDTLPVMELIIPLAISSLSLPAPIRLITSDSANTVHMLDIVISSPFSASFAKSSMDTPRVLDISSINLPVPAAHLSFIVKFVTLPLFKVIILVS